MPISVISNSDSKPSEAVDGNLADLASKKESEDEINESASSELDDESKDESETSESDDESSEEKSEKEIKPKKQGGFQRRINKLNSKISAKDQEIEYWRQEALKSKSSPKPSTQDRNQKDISNSDRPIADNFESHDEYIDALTDWKLEKKLIDRDLKQKQEQIKSEVQKRTQSHIERVKTFVEKHDDFSDLMEEVDDIIVPVAVQEIIVESENGPLLMYELAKNRKEFERICSLSPLSAAKALGKFESGLDSSDDNKNKLNKISKAPHPPTPIRSKSANSVKKSIYDSELSQAEYEALRRRQLSK